MFDFMAARADIINYLEAQTEEYFSERGRTKASVLQDEDLIDTLAAEHLKCVLDFDCARSWSVQDACDVEPGIAEPDEEI